MQSRLAQIVEGTLMHPLAYRSHHSADKTHVDRGVINAKLLLIAL